jgi:hypothetical protein
VPLVLVGLLARWLLSSYVDPFWRALQRRVVEHPYRAGVLLGVLVMTMLVVFMHGKGMHALRRSTHIMTDEPHTIYCRKYTGADFAACMKHTDTPDKVHLTKGACVSLFCVSAKA